MFAWVYLTSFPQNPTGIGGTHAIYGEPSWPGATGMGINIVSSGSNRVVAINTGTGPTSSRTWGDYKGTTAIAFNTWYHVGFTYDGTYIRIYVNGKLDATHAYTGQSNPADYVHLFSWARNGDITSYGSTYPAYKTIGSINDFRIYDHVLTNKEVKELAKGLIAHYQLKGMGATNYLRGSVNYREDTPLIRKASDVSHMYDSYTYHSDIIAVIPAEGTYTFSVNSDGNPSGHNTSGTVGASRLFSLWLYNTSTGMHYVWGNYGRGPDGRCYGIFNVPAGNYQIRINLYSANNAEYVLKIWDMKITQGAYSVNDTWCPHNEDEMYGLMELGSKALITDNSGFGNDLEQAGTIPVVPHSARYNAAANFNNSGYLYKNDLNIDAKELTIAFWINTPRATNAQHFICGTFNAWTSNGFGMWRDANMAYYNLLFKANNVGYTLPPSFEQDIEQWCHFAVVYNGTTISLYKNGVKYNTTTYGSSNTSFHPTLYLGNSMYEGAAAYEIDQAFMSDFRFYVTALSDADINDLYQVSASIEKTGKLFAYEFQENDGNNIAKEGVISTNHVTSKIPSTHSTKTMGLSDGTEWSRIHHLDLKNEKTFFTAAEVAQSKLSNRTSYMGDIDKYKVGSEYEFMLTYPTMKKTLPAGYTKLEYIEATGTQFIRTGVYPYTEGSYVRGHRWELDIEFKANGIRQLMGYGPYGGEYWGINSNIYEGMSVPAGKRDTIVHDYSKGTAGGNTLWAQNSYRDVGANLTTDQEYTLFNLKWGGNTGYWCYAKLYRCKCVQGNTLIRDFIPAMRNSDGAVGLFDIVNNVFYGNSGGGSFYSNYTWLDYLQSSGTQYINTGVIPNSNTRIVIKAQLDTPHSIYGVNQSGANFNITGSSSNGGVVYYYWGGGGASKMTNLFSEVHIFEQNKNICYVDNDIYHTYTNSSWAATAPIFLFGRNNGTALNDSGTARIYSCQIYDNGTLVRDFVPCLTNGTPGMYDLVNSAFYANAGSDNFKIGYKGSGYQWLEYIQNTGIEQINTGYPAPEGFISEAVVEYVTKAGGYVLGSHNIVSPWGRNGFGVNGLGYWELGTGDSCPASSSQVALNTKYSIKMSSVKGNSYLDVNGSRLISTTDSTDRSAGSIYIFRNQYEQYHNSSTSQIKLYSLKFWLPNGTLIRDFVPCISPIGKVGLYDKVTKRFFGNNGSGYLIAGPAKESLPLYNRWIQTSSPNSGSVSGFKPITTTWTAHNYGLRKHGSSCVYNCDSGDTWYAPIGQTVIWEGGIPAADGTMQLETELWVRTDRFSETPQASIYKDLITAKDFIEI